MATNPQLRPYPMDFRARIVRAESKLGVGVLQSSTSLTTVGSTVGISSSNVVFSTTFTGNFGATTYTLNDVIYALKKIGILST